MPTLRDLDRLIERRHLLKHPFYTAWSHGTVVSAARAGSAAARTNATAARRIA